MAAVFFDIDGTIWDRELVIPDSTVTAVKLLHENGHRAFLCSGRPRATIYGENLSALEMDGILAGCGTYIEYQGKVVFEKRLEPELLRRTVALLQRHHLPVLIEGNERLFMEDEILTDWYGGVLKKAIPDRVCPLEGNENRWEGSKFTVLTAGRDYLSALPELEPDYEILAHGDKVMELVPKGFSKATGIERTCALLEIPREDTYAFGDSVNDSDMLRYAAVGVAMGDGSEAAKEAADYITGGVHEDGIYRALQHFELI